jgi:hypothetical protein
MANRSRRIEVDEYDGPRIYQAFKNIELVDQSASDDSAIAPEELAQWSDKNLLMMREEIAQMIAILNEAARESYYNERFRDEHPRFSEWIESGMEPDSWWPRARRALLSHQWVDSTPSASTFGPF